MTKPYALIWERCTEGMQNKIQTRTDFETTIENDPSELLKAVKEYDLNYQKHRSRISIVLDSFKTMMSTKQKEHESLSDNTKRFKVAKYVMESHFGGPIILTQCVEQVDNYYATNQKMVKICVEEAHDLMLGLLYLENADQLKYGSILKGLSAQQSLGNNQYPKYITKANELLSNHPFDRT